MTEDDDATTRHTCILNSFICWVSVEVLTAFLVGIIGVSVSSDICYTILLKVAPLCFGS